MAVPYDERMARNRLDDGDPEEDVWIHPGSKCHTYHADPGCSTSGEEPEQIPRSEAQAKWYGACLMCVLGIPQLEKDRSPKQKRMVEKIEAAR